jgi:hypothetical protein
LKKVAIFTHSAAHARVAIIIAINCIESLIKLGSIIHFFIVLTTSHQAIITHEASNIAAIIIAHVIVIAFDQTAGHILLATSFAQILIAIYKPNTQAINKYILVFHHQKKNIHEVIISILIASISYLKFLFFLNQGFIFQN